MRILGSPTARVQELSKIRTNFLSLSVKFFGCKGFGMSNMDLSNVTFDVEEYASCYQGYTKLQRLGFIAETFPHLKEISTKQLLKELKSSSNSTLYLKVLQSVDEGTRRELGCDEGIAQVMQQNNQVRMDMLEAELSAAKSTMLKEGIRMGHTDIGHMQYQMGNLSEALKSFLRTRDFCTMPRHSVEMCMNVINTSIDLKQFFNVTNFINKVTDTLGDDVIIAKLKVASGLVELQDRQFKKAGYRFLEVNSLLGNTSNTTISNQDIGIYATICALATFDRNELRLKLIENKGFCNTYLNNLPDFKTLALSFYNRDHIKTLNILNSIRPRLLCDMYLHNSVDSLLDSIKEGMLLQYFTPYCTVNLNNMAEQMQMTYESLEDRLVELISSDKLNARIDASSRTLYRRSTDMKTQSLEKLLSLSTVHTHAIKRDILKLSMLQQGFVVGNEQEEGIEIGAYGTVGAYGTGSAGQGGANQGVSQQPEQHAASYGYEDMQMQEGEEYFQDEERMYEYNSHSYGEQYTADMHIMSQNSAHGHMEDDNDSA